MDGRPDAAFHRSMSARCPAGSERHLARRSPDMYDARPGRGIVGWGSQARTLWAPAKSATTFVTLFLCLSLIFRSTGALRPPVNPPLYISRDFFRGVGGVGHGPYYFFDARALRPPVNPQLYISRDFFLFYRSSSRMLIMLTSVHI